MITGFINLLPNDFVDPFAVNRRVRVATKSNKKKRSEIVTFSSKIADKFQSVDNLVLYLRMHAKNPNDKLELVNSASKLLKQRFVHAYSVYGMQENWIAAFAGKFIWRDLAAKVIPDDIMKGKAAACSQISIVMMEVCKRFEVPTRKVGLVGHYTMEALINGKWYFFDLDLKPNFNAIQEGRKSIEEILQNREQYELYANTILDSTDIERKFSNITYGKINTAPAPKAYLFHYVTTYLSHWGWIILLFIGLKCNRQKCQYT